MDVNEVDSVWTPPDVGEASAKPPSPAAQHSAISQLAKGALQMAADLHRSPSVGHVKDRGVRSQRRGRHRRSALADCCRCAGTVGADGLLGTGAYVGGWWTAGWLAHRRSRPRRSVLASGRPDGPPRTSPRCGKLRARHGRSAFVDTRELAVGPRAARPESRQRLPTEAQQAFDRLTATADNVRLDEATAGAVHGELTQHADAVPIARTLAGLQAGTS